MRVAKLGAKDLMFGKTLSTKHRTKLLKPIRAGNGRRSCSQRADSQKTQQASIPATTARHTMSAYLYRKQDRKR